MLNKVKIWEAARATSAATSFFNPITIGTESFVDGATGANNPINELWTELTIFGIMDRAGSYRTIFAASSQSVPAFPLSGFSGQPSRSCKSFG